MQNESESDTSAKDFWGRAAEEAKRKYKAAMSNGRGRQHEMMIEGGCRHYAAEGRAFIIKVPEPFRVLRKDRARGIATVQFTAKAQPDYIGCLAGGRMIVFEAKHTDTGRMTRRAVTPTQAAALAEYHRRGAVSAVCVGIGDDFFMVPWPVFADMKKIFGRLYVTAADIAEYKVKFTGVILFLDYVSKNAARLDGACSCATRYY